jgi:hypothetical protein
MKGLFDGILDGHGQNENMATTKAGDAWWIGICQADGLSGAMCCHDSARESRVRLAQQSNPFEKKRVRSQQISASPQLQIPGSLGLRPWATDVDGSWLLPTSPLSPCQIPDSLGIPGLTKDVDSYKEEIPVKDQDDANWLSGFEDGDKSKPGEKEANKGNDMFGINNPGKFFDKMDLDGNGTLDREELKAALEKSGIPMSEVERKLPALFSKMDKSGDGEISKEEFVQYWVDNKLLALHRKKKLAEKSAKDDLAQMQKAGEAISKIHTTIKAKLKDIEASSHIFVLNEAEKKKADTELAVLRGDLQKYQKRMSSLRAHYQDQQELQGTVLLDYRKVAYMRASSFTKKGKETDSNLHRTKSLERTNSFGSKPSPDGKSPSKGLKSMKPSVSFHGQPSKSGSFRKSPTPKN